MRIASSWVGREFKVVPYEVCLFSSLQIYDWGGGDGLGLRLLPFSSIVAHLPSACVAELPILETPIAHFSCSCSTFG